MAGREKAVQKMLLMNQMMQVLEVHNPIRDVWLTTACPSSGGRPRRSELDVVALAEACSRWRIRIECLGVAMDLRFEILASDCKPLGDEKPRLLILSPMRLFLSCLQLTQRGELPELREQFKRHLKFDM